MESAVAYREACLDRLDLPSPAAILEIGAGTGRFFLGQIEAFGPVMERSGLLPPDRLTAWVADQRQASEQGTFFASCNYAYIARRPV